MNACNTSAVDYALPARRDGIRKVVLVLIINTNLGHSQSTILRAEATKRMLSIYFVKLIKALCGRSESLQVFRGLDNDNDRLSIQTFALK